jgi:hypothetical protein
MRRQAQSMVHRKSIIKAAIDRLEGLMAIGESRREAKQAVRASGERIWAFSTGRIHSFKTRSVYQEHILRFINFFHLSCEAFMVVILALKLSPPLFLISSQKRNEV